MSQKTWGGRFSGSTDQRVEEFTESISIDRRLYRHDILASQAHAKMLAEVGLVTAEEATKIVMAAILIGCCLNFVITLFGGGFTSNETNMSVSIQAGERTIIQTLKLGIPYSQDGWNPGKN